MHYANRKDTLAMTPERRRQEVACILAGGILRLHARAALAGPGTLSAPEKPGNSAEDCLEVSAETVLSVHTG